MTAPAPLALHLTGPTLARLAAVRKRVAAWARGHGMDSDAVDDLVLATHEALANVADHAYAEGSAEAWLEALRPAPGTLLVLVSDRGRWRSPPRDPGCRGRGLTLIKGLAERVEVRRDGRGTTVAMYWSLPRT